MCDVSEGTDIVPIIKKRSVYNWLLKEKGCEKHRKGGCHFCSVHCFSLWLFVHLFFVFSVSKRKKNKKKLFGPDSASRFKTAKCRIFCCLLWHLKNTAPLTPLCFRIPQLRNRHFDLKPTRKCVCVRGRASECD